MSDEEVQLVRRYYRTYGSAGSFSSPQKLKTSLFHDGYKISLKTIRKALAEFPEFLRFLTTTKGLPKHIPQRFSLVSHPNLWLFGDCMTSKYVMIYFAINFHTNTTFSSKLPEQQHQRISELAHWSIQRKHHSGGLRIFM